MKKLVFAFSMILSIILLNIDVKAQNRPMSSQAKGALIGGAGGALLGAVVGHNVKGALLGAAIGAGSGYVIGNEHRMNEEKRYASYNRGYNSGITKLLTAPGMNTAHTVILTAAYVMYVQLEEFIINSSFS